MAVPIQISYVSKCNKLVQLGVQVKYHMNVIYNLGGGDTPANIPTLRTKAILRNQAHAGLELVSAWLIIKFFENASSYEISCCSQTT